MSPLRSLPVLVALVCGLAAAAFSVVNAVVSRHIRPSPARQAPHLRTTPTTTFSRPGS